MSILSLYEAKQPSKSKPGKLNYLQKLSKSKEKSSLLGEASTIPPMKESSVLGKDSDYNQDKITRYLG